jgi:hypothetical protein
MLRHVSNQVGEWGQEQVDAGRQRRVQAGPADIAAARFKLASYWLRPER